MNQYQTWGSFNQFTNFIDPGCCGTIHITIVNIETFPSLPNDILKLDTTTTTTTTVLLLLPRYKVGVKGDKSAVDFIGGTC